MIFFIKDFEIQRNFDQKDIIGLELNMLPFGSSTLSTKKIPKITFQGPIPGGQGGYVADVLPGEPGDPAQVLPLPGRQLPLAPRRSQGLNNIWVLFSLNIRLK